MSPCIPALTTTASAQLMGNTPRGAVCRMTGPGPLPVAIAAGASTARPPVVRPVVGGSVLRSLPG